jgi:hypothetical protein
LGIFSDYFWNSIMYQTWYYKLQERYTISFRNYLETSSLTIFHSQIHNYAITFYFGICAKMPLGITIYWLTMTQNIFRDIFSNYSTKFNQLLSKAHSSDPMDHNSNIFGWKITIPLISKSKKVNNIDEHIKMPFSTESKTWKICWEFIK